MADVRMEGGRCVEAHTDPLRDRSDETREMQLQLSETSIPQFGAVRPSEPYGLLRFPLGRPAQGISRLRFRYHTPH